MKESRWAGKKVRLKCPGCGHQQVVEVPVRGGNYLGKLHLLEREIELAVFGANVVEELRPVSAECVFSESFDGRVDLGSDLHSRAVGPGG